MVSFYICWWPGKVSECLLHKTNDLSHAFSVSLELDVNFQITCNKPLEFKCF